MPQSFVVTPGKLLRGFDQHNIGDEEIQRFLSRVPMNRLRRWQAKVVNLGF
jgi:hypothetical protein